MTEEQLYKTPIVSSWGAVNFVNHSSYGLINPEHPCAVIFLDENNCPRYLEDAENDPLKTKSFVVVVRRSGDPRPTETDIKCCEAWKKACEGTGIDLADYIIVCGGSHYSFASEKVEGPGPKGF